MAWFALRTRDSIVARRRRNRELDVALGVAQLIALLVVAGMFLPEVRQMLLGFGVILLGQSSSSASWLSE